MGLLDIFGKKSATCRGCHAAVRRRSRRLDSEIYCSECVMLALEPMVGAETAVLARILMRRGCDITADGGEIRIAMAARNSRYIDKYAYLVIRTDGIYFYREMVMGVYDLQRVVDCGDMAASFAVLCAHMLREMRNNGSIREGSPDYLCALQIMRAVKDRVLSSVPNASESALVDLITGEDG